MEWTLFISILHYPHLSPKHFFPEGSLLTSCLLCVCLIRCPVWACLRGYYWGNGNLLAATPLKKVTTDPQGVVGSHKLLPLPWWDADWPNHAHDLWSKHSYGELMHASPVLPSVFLEHISPSSNSCILFTLSSVIFLWALEGWYRYYFTWVVRMEPSACVYGKCLVSYLTFKLLESSEGPVRCLRGQWHQEPSLTTWVLLLGPTWWHGRGRKPTPASCPLASTNSP